MEVAMNSRLYIVEQQIDGACFITPCVGEEELRAHAAMSEHFGVELVSVSDVESELARFVWDCCFEGSVREWLKDA